MHPPIHLIIGLLPPVALFFNLICSPVRIWRNLCHNTPTTCISYCLNYKLPEWALLYHSQTLLIGLFYSTSFNFLHPYQEIALLYPELWAEAYMLCQRVKWLHAPSIKYLQYWQRWPGILTRLCLHVHNARPFQRPKSSRLGWDWGTLNISTWTTWSRFTFIWN